MKYVFYNWPEEQNIAKMSSHKKDKMFFFLETKIRTPLLCLWFGNQMSKLWQCWSTAIESLMHSYKEYLACLMFFIIFQRKRWSRAVEKNSASVQEIVKFI